MRANETNVNKEKRYEQEYQNVHKKKSSERKYESGEGILEEDIICHLKEYGPQDYLRFKSPEYRQKSGINIQEQGH